MNALELMIELQRQNRDSLGFIPSPSLQQRYYNTNQYLIQTHRTAGKIGFVLFSRPRPHRILHVHQCCIQLDYRRHERAAELIARLKKIATDAGCSEIQLRCAADLEANAFWKAIGAELLGTYLPRTARSRCIHHYSLLLPTNTLPLLRNQLP